MIRKRLGIENYGSSRNGSSYPYGSYSGKTFYSVKGWTENGDTNYDYGAIKVNGSPGNTVGWYGYRTTNSSSPGFPQP